MTLARFIGSAVVAVGLAGAGPAWAQSAGPGGITPTVGGSGTTAAPHVSGFNTGPGLQPQMAAPGPETTEPPRARRTNVPPPTPVPETGAPAQPSRNAGETAAPAPNGTRGVLPDTTGPNGINPDVSTPRVPPARP